MKKLATLTIIAAFIGGIGIIAGPGPADAHSKYEICHKGPGACVGQVVCISQKAWSNKHGTHHQDAFITSSTTHPHTCPNEGNACLNTC